jgi:hypothetical protein
MSLGERRDVSRCMKTTGGLTSRRSPKHKTSLHFENAFDLDGDVAG